MSNLRLSAESSLFYQYNKNKAKKDLHPFVLPAHDSSASDQESDVSTSKGDGDPQDDFNGFTPEVSHTNNQPEYSKGSLTRKPVTRRTPVVKKDEVGTKFNSDDFFRETESLSEKTDKKTKPPARNAEKKTTKNPPPAKKRGKKNAENPSTETGNEPEPDAKRPRVASKRRVISTAEPPAVTPVSTEHADKDNIPKKNPRENNISKNVGEVTETDLSAGGSKSKPPKSAGENKGRGRPKKAVAAECAPVTSSSSPTKSLVIVENHSRVEAKMPEAKNDKAREMILKTEEKPKERIYHFLSSSESEVEDEEDDEDDIIFPSSNSFWKTKSPRNAVPMPSFKTPTTVTNKVSELISPKTSKFRLLPEPVPLLRTPRRTLTLVKELSPNRVEQSISDAEDVADTDLYKRSQKKTQLKPSTSQANEKSIEETPVSKRRSFSDSAKKPSPTKRLQSRVKSSQQLNDSENVIYGDEKSNEETPVSKRRNVSDSSMKPSPTKRLQSRVKSSQQPNDPENSIYGDDSGLIEAVRKRTMLRSENSTGRQVPLRSAIDPTTLPVPNRSPLPTTFNLYLASPGDPIRAQQLLSNAEYNISLVHLLPKIIFPLKINNPMLVMRLKGSVEFRSDPHAPSRILLNSSTRLVDLKAGRILHVVNTEEEVASFQLTEILQQCN